ncbi:MAG TPA: sensor histidine kinase, partial [Coriobacteriia bacterium]
IEQALMRLLSNAVKYAPEAEEVRVTLVRNRDKAVLSVIDEGPGVPPGDLERVFDRFYKSGDTRDDPGTGLGLYLVRMIVRAHGGTVTVASKPQQGSTFTMKMPLVAPRTGAEGVEPDTAPRDEG